MVVRRERVVRRDREWVLDSESGEWGFSRVGPGRRVGTMTAALATVDHEKETGETYRDFRSDRGAMELRGCQDSHHR